MGYHETLGVQPGASDAEIHQAYRKAAKEVHPDLSHSAEAVEAFKRIKEAHDALINKEVPVRDANTIHQATARAAQATAAAAFTPPTPPSMSEEEVARIQELDKQASKKPKFSFFRRVKEPAEVRRHRRSIKTNNRRLDGKY